MREQVCIEKMRKIRNGKMSILAAGFFAVMVTFGDAMLKSSRTSQREASIFASLSATAFEQGFCDRAGRLAVAGLPPAEGASAMSFRSPKLQGELSFFGSKHDCYFELALGGHTALVNSATFSPDGSRVLTASWDATARVWDAKTGQSLATLSGHKAWVNSAAFGPDGFAWRLRLRIKPRRFGTLRLAPLLPRCMGMRIQ